jgi:steroid 5-alpha reductase family enzyme
VHPQLGGVTAWGVRLLSTVSARAASRGHDDVRYTKDKIAPGFWRGALLSQFAPEALFQTLISLPLAVPMRSTRVALVGWGWADLAAVGVFSAGFALEALADGQKAVAKKQGVKGLYQGGVWSIVRHPKCVSARALCMPAR